jgi:2-isopropylmalate synthase
MKLDVYDTTLRDGSQREGISLSCEDKLRIARLLDRFGVPFIEAGWPGSNPKDAELFQRIRDEAWTSEIVAFGSTCRPGSQPGEDDGLRTLIAAGTKVCTLFGKSWGLHVTDVLRTSADENLRIIEESVAFLRKEGRRVIYDAEHFFDGYRADPVYALETARAAIRGGAEVVVLCDTNGGSMPWQVEQVVGQVSRALMHPLGVHAHNDGECAVANSLAAVRSGATHLQGTINGYGERCGNANLCALIPNLALKLGAGGLPPLEGLSELSRAVAEIANLATDDHMAYVGRSAFAHKGGVHVAATRRNPAAYQHIDPAAVGNDTRVVVSELSGRATVLAKAEEHGVATNDSEARAVLTAIKDREARGLSFEAAEASIALMLKRQQPGYQPPFRLIDYKVMVGERAGMRTFAEATIQIAIGDETLHTAAEGNGPVSALDLALRKALQGAFPAVAKIQLVDYKVRILDGRDGTQATTRVLIDSTDGERRWSTVGASSNIIEASWHALADSIEYGVSP